MRKLLFIFFFSWYLMPFSRAMERETFSPKEKKRIELSKDPLQLAKAAYRYGNIEICKQHLSKVKDPLQLAKFAYKFGDIAVCKQHLNKVKDNDFDLLPDHKKGAALYDMGSLLEQVNNDITNANIYINEALKQDKNIYYRLGEKLFKKGDDKAIEYLYAFKQYAEEKKTLDKKTQNRIAKTYFILATIHFKKLVMPYLEKASQYDSSEADFQLAKYYEGEEAFSKALLYYKNVQEKEKKQNRNDSSLANNAARRAFKLNRRINITTQLEEYSEQQLLEDILPPEADVQEPLCNQ